MQLIPGLKAIALMGLAAAATLVPAASAIGAPYSPPSPPPPGALTVNTSEWSGHGALAFVSRSHLYRLSPTGHLVAIGGAPSSGFDSNPAWSPDGKWLAFLHTAPAHGFDVPHASLWLVAAGATVAQQATARPIGAFHWSPTSDVLAYLSWPGSSDSGSLWELHPGSRPSATATATNVASFLWSPSGSAVALLHRSGNGSAFRTSIEVVPSGHGPTITWWQSSTIECVTLASYDPSGDAIVAWVNQGCDVDADGEPLQIFRVGQPPITVGTSLIDMTSLSWSPKGNELAMVSPGDRTIWASGKNVELCSLSPVKCTPLAIPNGMVGLDPAWTAAGNLYFVVASGSGPFSSNGSAYYSPGWIAQWQATHAAWVLPSNASTPGAVRPLLGNVLTFDAAAKSDSLLFVRNDSIYLLAQPGDPPIRIAGPLLGETAPSGYYGLTDWGALFSWSEANEPSEVLSQVSSQLPSELEQVPNPPSTR